MTTKADTVYLDLRISIQQEKDERVREHRNAIAQRRLREMAFAATRPEELNMLAQGDSWFDYPLPPPGHSDVIAQLRHMADKTPLILSLAVHGEAAEDMLGVHKLHELMAELTNRANGKFDAILFSGGGNDLAGDQFRLWLKQAAVEAIDPADALNDPRVQCILGVVMAGYQDLIEARNRFDRTIPIFGHSYDFPIPDGRAPPCVGPWLKPSLDDRGWTDPAMARAIVRRLLVEFDAMLSALAADTANNFIHVKTQGTLTDAQWANELHPTPDGFKAITRKFVDALRARFPGRI